MKPHDLHLLLSGALILGLMLSALFFLRFWSTTRERLFAWFAASFALLACERLLLVWSPLGSEVHLPIFLIRLAAFGLMIAAIIDKNRK